MIFRWVKLGVITTVGLGLVGGLLFGSDVVSYVKSSAKGVRTAVKDSVPVEFELRRARDMLEEIIPEMHANIRLIAQEQVEVACLKGEIAKAHEALQDEQTKVKTLRIALEQPQAQFRFAGRDYTRYEVKEDLAARFERYKESEMVLASKVKLLDARERSLDAAMQVLERTKSQKRILENKIESLASQYRIVKAASVGSQIQVDDGKLAQTEKLITEIQKRLDVAERVLAYETKFVESIPVDTVPEQNLVAQVDEYFDRQEREPQEQDDSLITMGDREEASL